jgi:Metal binding domain of Ada
MRAIIRYMQEKLKSWLSNDQLFYGSLLILVGIGSFALGQLSVQPKVVNLAPKVEFTGNEALLTMVGENRLASSSQSVDSIKPAPTAFSVVASKSGTKYHLPTCAGAKQIKPENLVTFASSKEAEMAGYTPAANCPGLK